MAFLKAVSASPAPPARHQHLAERVLQLRRPRAGGLERLDRGFRIRIAADLGQRARERAMNGGTPPASSRACRVSAAMAPS